MITSRKAFTIVLTALISLTVFHGCNHQPKNPRLSAEWEPLPKRKRFRLIKKATKNFQYYRGLDLLFDINVTFINDRILQDNLKIKSQYMMWGPEQARDEQSALDLKKVNESSFFVTLYANDKNINQLNLKSANWTATIILDDGSVLDGKIKLYQNLSHHNAVFFPHVESWDKSYMVTFDLPTSKLSGEKFVFIITSPRGSARFDF